MSILTLAALHRAVDPIAARPDRRADVVTGAGVSLCSGADVKSGPEDMAALEGAATGELNAAVAAFREGRKPEWSPL